MLSLSKKTDYALLALSHLAKAEPGRAVNTREIADQFAIPTRVACKDSSTAGESAIGGLHARPDGRLQAGKAGRRNQYSGCNLGNRGTNCDRPLHENI